MATQKEFYQLIENRKLAFYVKQEYGQYNNPKYTQEDYDKAVKAQDIVKKKLSRMPSVYVSFLIGSRCYYRQVIKIGKSYFCKNNGEKMTRSRGYSCIEEIPAITEKMKSEMLADSYYY